MTKSSPSGRQQGGSSPSALGIETVKVPFDRPWDWLAAGWRDLWLAPASSLVFGGMSALAGLALAFFLAISGFEALIPVLGGGFALVGPLLAAGLYEKSRRIADGQSVRLGDTVNATARSMGRLGLFAAILLIVYLVWIRLAFLLLALFLGSSGLPPVREFTSTLLFTTHGLGLLVVGTLVGALLAGFVFMISAVAIPLLMERDVDAITAMTISGRAVIASPKAMLLWAALIAGFTGAGVLTMGVGLVVAFPLIGHATWHAYRDVVAREPKFSSD